MKYEPPSDFDVRECQTLLNRFQGDEPIDDPEDFLDDIPTYLEWIIAQHGLLKKAATWNTDWHSEALPASGPVATGAGREELHDLLRKHETAAARWALKKPPRHAEEREMDDARAAILAAFSAARGVDREAIKEAWAALLFDVDTMPVESMKVAVVEVRKLLDRALRPDAGGDPRDACPDCGSTDPHVIVGMGCARKKNASGFHRERHYEEARKELAAQLNELQEGDLALIDVFDVRRIVDAAISGAGR